MAFTHSVSSSSLVSVAMTEGPGTSYVSWSTSVVIFVLDCVCGPTQSNFIFLNYIFTCSEAQRSRDENWHLLSQEIKSLEPFRSQRSMSA